ncbi:hypothetical protein BD779DRAFT_1675478 [Infundibulicybe gibba]|nr:hypothetical protein BD779DRAFT_1675478 [Infundibulicybe gibba]
MQEGESYLACTRPPTREHKLPLALLHPVFGEFADDFKNAQITNSDVVCARELWRTMSWFDHDTCFRYTHLGLIFQRYGIHLDSLLDRSVGHVSPAEHPALICAVGNEIGSPGPEPSLQALVDYRNAIRKSYDRSTCHPCFILFIAGPYLGLGGCAWTDRASMEIFALLPLSFHSLDSDAEEKLARHLAALKKAVNTLIELYTKMGSTPGPTPSSAGHPRPSRKAAYPPLPYKTEFTHLKDGQLVSFSYESERAGESLIYFGQMEGSHSGRICIKFVRRYGRDVHVWCASQYFAPKLLGFETLPGGWFMVVMERLDDSWTPLRARRRRHPEGLEARIRAQLAALHAQGMVHGNLRPRRVLVRESSAANSEIAVIGFDCAGRTGRCATLRFWNRIRRLWTRKPRNCMRI